MVAKMEQDNIINLIDTEEEYSKKVIEAYLTEDSNKKKIDIVHNDYDLVESDTDSMKIHNQCFSQLLKAYVKNADKNLTTKLSLKITFFYICIVILILITFSTVLISIFALFNDFEKSTLFSILLTNSISFLTSFIVLPKIIAKYLFNTEEEKNMSDIIKSIQEYDKNIRNGLK